MDIKTLAPAEAKTAITAMDTVKELRTVATSLGIAFSGNTGKKTLKQNIKDYLSALPNDASVASGMGLESPVVNPVLDTTEPLPEIIKQPKVKGPPSIPELLLMDVQKVDPSNQILIRQIVRANALKLSRVRIMNLDPADAQLSGGIITVMNKYTGKVSKYIPFGEESENGYHIPQIILTHLQAQKFALRRETKGGQFGVKKYNTTMVHKFSIEILPDLTEEELSNLSSVQQASHAIDN